MLFRSHQHSQQMRELFGGSALAAPHLRALLELLEAEGHDVVALREELAHLLRVLMRARHGGFGVNHGKAQP